jgi:hypothetical protein
VIARRDITGKVFSKSDEFGNVGSLKVIRLSGSGRHGLSWVCLCSCGKEVVARSDNLISGRQVSCGCYNDRRKRLAIKHGHSRNGQRSSEYISWHMMLQRCNNPNTPCYEDYGGRGIKVCERWRKFENFLEDMGKKPDPKMTIDRVDVNGNYEPTNCCWATRKQQRANQRSKSATS